MIKDIKLDIGCGKFKLPGFIGIDIDPESSADLLHDINTPLPYPDNSIDEIYCSHLLEHCKNVEFVLNEFYRICKPGTVINCIVPLLEWYSSDHIQNFGPGHFHKFIDLDKFEINHLAVTEKAVNRPVKNPDPADIYYIFEKSFTLIVKK
jgi:predicted SAM-dependent methyltransferase